MKLLQKRLLLSLVVFLGLGIGITAASYYHPQLLSNHPFLQELVAKFLQYQDTFKEDKVYVQFDKKFFEPGEDIWFNAYVRDGASLQKSSKSGVVYVDLINPQGSAIQKRVLLAQNGQGAGEFHLDEHLKGGLYKVKAYTKWQKNTNTFFERDITIQKSVLPNLNMQLNFDRKAYGANEKVSATLDLNSLTKEPLANHAFSYVVSLNGDKLKKGNSQTNDAGRAKVAFNLPKKLKSNDGLLNIMLAYKGQTESISRSIPIVLGNIDLQFYPEGGELVEGMIGNLGFKALNEFGKPADIKGKIYDQNNKVVATFASYHQGMGKVAIAPQEGQQYYAEITHPANITQKYSLPQVRKQGYTLNVKSQNKQGIHLDVISSKEEELFVVAQHRNNIFFTKDIKASAGINNAYIPTNDLPIGITQLTLFDSKKVARAERLVFINKGKQLDISIETDKEKYLPREKVNMTVNVKDEDGQPVDGNFSLAVVDDKLLTFADDKQGHILSHILLESDLQGEIEEPNFYFDDENDPKRLQPNIDRQEALDHLLMTQGWRKFEWKEVIEESYTPYATQGEPAIIEGQVVDLNGQPVANAAVSLLNTEIKTETDENGSFLIENFEMYQSVQLEVSKDTYYPFTIPLQDYSQQLKCPLYKKITVKGVVKNKKNKKLAKLQVYGGPKNMVATNQKGEFEIEVPENLKQLTIYGSSYGYENKNVEITEQPLAITLNVQRIYPTSSNRGGFGRKGRHNRLQKAADVNPAPPAPPAPELNQNVLEEIEEEPMAVEDMDDVALEVDDVEKVAEKPIVAIKDKEVAGEAIAPADGFAMDRLKNEPFLGANLNRQARKPMRRDAPFRATQSRYSRVRVFAAPNYEDKQQPEMRTDFRKTIYWNPNIAVKDGQASLSFYNSDAITQFRVTLEGFSNKGGLGRAEQKYFTQLPFEMITKVPREVLTGDIVNIPLTLTNNTNELVAGQLTLHLPTHINLLKEAPSTVKLQAKESKTIFLHCSVMNKLATGDFTIAFEAEGLSDKFQTAVVARPRGFPVNDVFSGDQLHNTFKVNLQEPLEGTVTAKLQAYPNVLEKVMSGMASMMRMPGGCFEQTSSANYPNLLVLDYLRETGTSNLEVEEKAKSYLQVGYKRLVGYESNGGGFDWWGRNPAHEALSAYGLMEFVDMQAVFEVDPQIIKRTAKWLLSRRDGNGGWKKNQHALHSWAVAEVTDAYIVWALCEAGYADKIAKEINKSYKDAVRSEDPYMMALVANALFKAKDTRAEKLTQELAKLQKKDGSFTGLTSSVTNSTGHSLLVETTSLAALAMMQTKRYTKQVNTAISKIQGGKTYYGYGSTQGTVLALKAMLQHAKKSKQTDEGGTLLVYVNNKKVSSLTYEAGQKELIIPNLAQHLKEGKQKITVKYEETKAALPFDLELTYTTRLPQNSPECNLSLQTEMPKNKVNMGETIRLTTTLSNKTDQGQPMTMAMIGIPAGLSLQPWQLKELQEKKAFDYYELFDGYVVLHYEQMEANASKTVALDLKADIPGEYEAPASSAFLYYTNEHRVWSMPERMTIN